MTAPQSGGWRRGRRSLTGECWETMGVTHWQGAAGVKARCVSVVKQEGVGGGFPIPNKQ